MRLPALTLLTCSFAFATIACAQQSASATLTPDQQTQLEAAKKDFNAAHWSEAVTELKALHAAVPTNADVAKFAAEASLNSNDPATALTLLQPIAEASPDDWQAHALLARAYAESHQDAKRDAALQQLLALHKTTTDVHFQQLTQFMVERVALPSGRLDIFYSLVPWSRYNIYEMARAYNASGQQTMRITLESNDADQALWAQKHAKEAAAGMREFSMDGYTEQVSTTGEHTQSHITFGFFDGQPSYATVRDRMVAIASGKGNPISSTSGIHPQSQ